jgi:hypothetical protein
VASRSRLPELGTGNCLDPMDALQAYLANRADLNDISELMMATATALLANEEYNVAPSVALAAATREEVATRSPEDDQDNTSHQLRLL